MYLGCDTKFLVTFPVDFLKEDIADTTAFYVEAANKLLTSAKWRFIVDRDFRNHDIYTIVMPTLETLANALDEFVTGNL